MLNAERGLVLERKGNRVIVLTPAGEWRSLYLPDQSPAIGEEIMLPPVKRKPFWPAVAGAAAIILLLILALPLARRAVRPLPPGEPVYYVTVDINPSVELAVDNQERVASARGLNSDGEKLLASLALKEEKIATAIKLLTREAVRQGYYLPDREGAMVVAVIPASGAEEKQLAAGNDLGQKLTREARDILQQARVPAVVEAAVVQPEIRQHAEASGLSAGKYSLLLEALDAGLPVTAADLQKEGLTRVLGRLDGNWEQLLQKLQQDSDLLQKEKQLGATLKKALGQQPAADNNRLGDNSNKGQGPTGNAGNKEKSPGNQDRPGPGQGPADPGQGRRPAAARNNPAARGGGKASPIRVLLEKGYTYQEIIKRYYNQERPSGHLRLGPLNIAGE
ncbi:MAG: hypothetical protein PWQ18_1304 [Clostridia bacterium]|nr:hypothetical protein [Clostridia bacterium]